MRRDREKVNLTLPHAARSIRGASCRSAHGRGGLNAVAHDARRNLPCPPYRSIPAVVVTARDLTAEEEAGPSLAVGRKGARLEQELREALQGIP